MRAARWAPLWPLGLRRWRNPRAACPADSMQASLLGPEFSDDEIEAVFVRTMPCFRSLKTDALLDFTVELLKTEKVVGWFQGRMEFGPRALGNRSILGDARSTKMQSVMNLKVKFRESFRPFAPIVRRERVADYFELDAESPYMLLVAPVKKELHARRFRRTSTVSTGSRKSAPRCPPSRMWIIRRAFKPSRGDRQSPAL